MLPTHDETKRAKARAYYNANKERIQAVNARWYAANRERVRETRAIHYQTHKVEAQRGWIRRTYGVEALGINKGEACPICLQRPTRDIDHDHETGKVRAALCRQCNVVLGHAGDNPDILMRAITYLIAYGLGDKNVTEPLG